MSRIGILGVGALAAALNSRWSQAGVDVLSIDASPWAGPRNYRWRDEEPPRQHDAHVEVRVRRMRVEAARLAEMERARLKRIADAPTIDAAAAKRARKAERRARNRIPDHARPVMWREGSVK